MGVIDMALSSRGYKPVSSADNRHNPDIILND